MPDLAAFFAKRDALFRNPTLEGATAHYVEAGFPAAVNDTVPLAVVHKARLHWLEATDAMLVESEKWLRDNGYTPMLRGGAPLTPATRDQQRMRRGLPPLGKGA